MIINEKYYTPHWPIPLGHKPIDLGLERIRAVLDKLGNPEKILPPIIHVAGTNGKGSTIAFMRAIAEAAGYKVHVYTSPHLVHFNERILLAGKEIDDAFLYETLEACRVAAKGIPLTFFEGTTAAALLAFSQVPADIVLLETGLGGRLDATNIIDQPALTVITPVSFDHTEFLGSTLGAIAGEKAGILKKDVACVVATQAEEAATVIEAKAAKLGSPLLWQNKNWKVVGKVDFTYSSAHHTLPLPAPSLPGKHQLTNAGTAITAMLTLPGFSITAGHIEQGITHTTHRARLQKLKTGALAAMLPPTWELWLDGGHNPAGGEVLASMASQWHDKPLYLICGMLKDKDSKGFLAPLASYVQKMVCISIPDEPKAMVPEALNASALKAGITAVTCSEGIAPAIQYLLVSGQVPARILISGSLYLAGHVLRLNDTMETI